MSNRIRSGAWRLALPAAAGLVLASQAHAASPSSIDQQKQQAFSRQSGEQAGTVESYSNGTLTYKPYQADSAQTVALDPSAPVFQGTGKITALGLQRGVDVRVHFTHAGGTARALGVEVLDGKQAAAAKAQAAVGGNRDSTTTTPLPGQPAFDKAHKEAVSKASGSQPGKVVSLRGGTLEIDPYQIAAGNARLHIAQDAPVFQGNARVSTLALQPGVDVRVYYDKAQRDVVAVDVLTPDQAENLRKAEENVPRRK